VEELAGLLLDGVALFDRDEEYSSSGSIGARRWLLSVESTLASLGMGGVVGGTRLPAAIQEAAPQTRPADSAMEAPPPVGVAAVSVIVGALLDAVALFESDEECLSPGTNAYQWLMSAKSALADLGTSAVAEGEEVGDASP